MKNLDFIDHRVFARLPLKRCLRFLEKDREGKSKAQTTDISANGIGFISRRRLAPNTPLEIWMDVPDRFEPLYIKGKVTWSKSLGNILEWRTGVHFEKVNLIDLGRIYHKKNVLL